MKLRAIATALPEWRVDHEQIAAWSGLGSDFIDGKIGVRGRRFLRAGESGTALSLAACRALMAAEPALTPSRIGLVVLVTQNPDYRLPHGAGLIQDGLGLPRTVASLDIGLGCSGYVYGLVVAEGLMRAQGIEDALLVTCDPYSKVMRRDDRDVIGIFGDAATATWLSAERGGRLGLADLGTDGAGHGALIVRHGGAADPPDHLDGTERPPASDADRHLHMAGRSIFNFMIQRVPETVDRCLARNGLTRADIDLFAFHQASRFMIEALRQRMDLPPERAPVDISETGNTVSSSIPLLLAAPLSAGALAGKRVLLCGFGVGLSWGSVTVEFGDQS